MEADRTNYPEGLTENFERSKIMSSDNNHKKDKTMVSCLMPTPILDCIDDIGSSEDWSRSYTLVRLVKRGLKNYDYNGGSFQRDNDLVQVK